MSTGEPSAKSALRTTAHGATDTGLKRMTNEDAFLVDDSFGLYVVADGMGGHPAGEIASQEAIETIFGMVKQGLRALPQLAGELNDDRARAACRLIEGAVQAATYMVFAMGDLDRDKTGMGTTISALLALGGYAVTAQVGDSRIYHVHQQKVVQITEDHTLISWQLKQGFITPEDAEKSPHRNVITRAVGDHEYVEVDTGLLSLVGGDRFLLCSDGLHGYLHEPEISHIISLGCRPAVHRFIELANDRGGMDNITAIVVEVG